MKKKINAGINLVALLAIAATMVLFTAVFYGVFKSQIMADLRIYALLLREESPGELERTGRNMREEKVRITIMDPQGQVLYDNWADSVGMGNHGMRPEVRQAIDEGEGLSLIHI